MNPQHPASGDTGATPHPTATPASPHYKNINSPLTEPVVSVAAGVATGDVAEARRDANHALTHDLKFTLTIGEAQQMFKTLHRRVPSQRSIQRYCNAMQIAAQVIHTSFGREWLLNEDSLVRYIETLPIMGTPDAGATPHPTATPASPLTQNIQQLPLDTVDSGASVAKKIPDMTPLTTDPDEPGVIGETRSRADILIENARLLAITEGQQTVITELKDEQAFMREEIRDARTMRRDVTRISDKMLSVMQSIATAGRALKAPDRPDTIHADIETPDSRG